ncbi:hypothetical protein SAMN04244573_04664 [Azotobacter beijerinckii]|uniref:HEAT repeat-containing protein n=1 Tax=Azotobacter beijerinckii TaxID=170623 RepID=A0A1H6ZYJ0_9GAMM|nr:hypothetical protein [Azotobacter beijerinckii]SEJ58543.1 hypothetical protein SAMN04244579_04861 [Azotobacter beijerinckii]SER96548.1 hypothetical protein SAMN04244573_04664 [Azotobacter beijerinckii]
MNDPKVAAAALSELIDELKNAHALVERAALFSAICLLCDDLSNADDDLVNGYAKEKAGQIRWHSAAALGFDITNGHSAEDHRVWALGALSSLEGSLPD